MIAQMNLLATSLTLLTFISRFIFPQVSLEARRFCILGMAPIDRGKILRSKLTLSLIVSILIGLFLILLSSVMLKSPVELTVLHGVTIVGVCVGLSGLSVGLGTLYPNPAEENPSKIVSGFGGTLNLVFSLGFLLAVIGVQAIPCYFYFSKKALAEETFHLILGAAVVLIVALSLFACWLPITLGSRKIRRMEL